MVNARDNSVKEQFNIGDFEQKATKVEDTLWSISFHKAYVNLNNALIGFGWNLLGLTGFEDCKELDSWDYCVFPMFDDVFSSYFIYNNSRTPKREL